jgi:nicotinic acid mononucleotide adenylyltransferase
MTGDEAKRPVYDLPQLWILHQALDTLELTAPPTVRVVYPQNFSPPRRTMARVGILCGSFNPLTLAHTELAAAARAMLQLDCVLLTVAKVTVDKEHVVGLGLEDRLLLLLRYAQRHPPAGVALVNRGLYFEQARAFRSLLGGQAALYFVVGMDKLVQILDPRYYQDRDAALRQLFALASLVVANREQMDYEAFTQLLAQPENRPYQASIHFCPLAAAVSGLSATAIRSALTTGALVTDTIPGETADFLAETRAYYPPLWNGEDFVDAYAIRLVLLEALYAVYPECGQVRDFRPLLLRALSPSDAGRAFRRAANKAEREHLLRSWREP